MQMSGSALELIQQNSTPILEAPLDSQIGIEIRLLGIIYHWSWADAYDTEIQIIRSIDAVEASMRNMSLPQQNGLTLSITRNEKLGFSLHVLVDAARFPGCARSLERRAVTGA